MDTLIIKGLQVSTIIGVYAWEKSINQELLIDITISSDFSACDDSLDSTLDYDALCKKVTEFVQAHSFQLIESVANQVASLIKQEFDINNVTIGVSKPHAIKNANTVQVVVNR